MLRTKLSIGVLLAIILLTTQVLVAGAAPAKQDTPPITGNVDNVEIQTNPDTLEMTVLVTITDETGTQTLELSLDTAIELGLVILDETGTPNFNEEARNTTIEINPTTVLSTAPVEELEKEHPVGSALSDFFSELLGVDYGTIMEYHNDGYGFGVIAQALWMTRAIEGDTHIFTLIVEAKKTKDFSELGVTMPDGSIPQNWGQFHKAVMSDREKAKENLGAVMSGRAEKLGDETLLEQGSDMKSNNGNGIGKSNNDNTTAENNGKNNPGNDKSNNGNNQSKDKSNNGKDKNKNK